MSQALRAAPPAERPMPPARRRRRKAQSRSEQRRARQRAQARRRRASLSPLGVTLVVAAALALLLGIAFVTGFLAPPGTSIPAGPPATISRVVRSDAASITFDSYGGWLADDTTGTVRRFDPRTGDFEGAAVRIGGTPISISSGYGRVWVAAISASQISAIDPRTGKLSLRPVQVAQGPVSVAVGDGGAWVASLLAGTVSLIDPHDGQVTASVALPDGAVRLFLGDGHVWVTGKTDTLTRIDPRPLGFSLRWSSVKVGRGPIGVAVGAGSVWVADAEAGTLSRVSPKTMSVTGTFHVPSGSDLGSSGPSRSDPETVCVWKNLVWVGEGGRQAVVALDARTGTEVGSAVTLPGTARDLVTGPEGDLWASTANRGDVVRLSPR